MENPKRIAVIGTGYVGLVAGACFADWGHRVTCVDLDAGRIDLLNRGGIPIYEPGLAEVVERAVKAGNLSFTTKVADAVAGCDAAYIAVGTPPSKTDGEADLSFVFECARQIARVIRPGAVIVTKSTVPVGTGDIVERIVEDARPGEHIPVVSNPEFLREGSAINDFTNPDRVVIGTEDEGAKATLLAIYQPLKARGHAVVVTRRRSAELIKYASNAFLAAKITFINEMADLCEAVEADVADIALGVGLDSRIGPHFLHAGPGYGGSCFPKDTLALIRTAQEHGVSLRIVEETVQANSARKRRMAMKVRHVLHGNVEGKKIAILGLTFKADTDDMRDSPAIPMIELLQRSGAEIHAYDPQGEANAKTLFEDVTFHEDPYGCAAQADAVVFMTDWEVLKHLDLARLASIMESPVMIDLRRIYPPEAAARQGFVVETIGRLGSEPHPVDAYAPTFLAQDIAAGTHRGRSLPAYQKQGGLPSQYVNQEEQLFGELIERKDENFEIA
ncbi:MULTISPECIES: UDP-glucose dehydrogenase family protein [Mesorhizobium]|uniref:UDP-glucose 6-dehydrogenase n=1 Tax=Mesorhizobium erdmanii TaxID=1777866 RepID=A0A6M7UIN7_9HYPH|nr:UDP-glucose 6-dehydrogenase [Mesorhizobium loti]QKC76018.1 UDP-glucose/GDP-mannose dehydrogenase family protein [Mesorhizobium erdmanii]